MGKWSYLLLGVAILLFPQALKADTIKIKKSGSSFNGYVIYESDTEIWLDIGTGKIVFKKDEVIRKRNDLGPSRKKERVSFVQYGGSSSKKSGQSSTTSTSKGSSSKGSAPSKPEKAEIVPAEILSEIQSNIRKLQRTRTKYRVQARKYLNSVAAKYPQTVSTMVLSEGLDHNFPRVRWLSCEILGETKYKKNIEFIYPLLKDKDKWVRYHSAMALKKLSGKEISYPKPDQGLDHSVSSEEQDRINLWEKYYNEYKQEKFKEEIRRQQTEKAAKAKGSGGGDDTAELLKKLKLLLEKEKNKNKGK